MMLLQRIKTLVKPRRPHARWKSGTSSVSYPSQVRAYPFAFDQEEAIRVAAWSRFHAWPWPTEFFRAAAVRFLPWLGVRPEQPSKITAVYIPGWIIDADVGVEMWGKFKAEVIERVVIVLAINLPVRALTLPARNGSLSGSEIHICQVNLYVQLLLFAPLTIRLYAAGLTYDPLAQLSAKEKLRNKDLPFHTVPWTTDLQNQHGLDVQCLPFVVTPFSLIDAARTISSSDAVISDTKFDRKHILSLYPAKKTANFPSYSNSLADGIRFTPSSINAIFYAVYPVLIPIYVLLYEVDSFGPFPKQTTVMVDASQEKGKSSAENLWRSMTRAVPQLRLTQRTPHAHLDYDLMHTDRRWPFTFPRASFATIDKETLPKPLRTRLRRRRLIDFWVNSWANEAKAMEKYKRFEQARRTKATNSSNIDWSDVRIKEYVPSNALPVCVYMKVGDALLGLHELQKALNKHIRTVRMFESAGLDSKMQQLAKDAQSLTGALKELAELRDKIRPQWLKEYNAQQQDRRIGNVGVVKEIEDLLK
ncbi:hypothetical protein NM688_g4801 [Phlebia brevispora]|uniref:Uncharacterized protein n=1 Tax=Phlebia brevispora TaxID=194682 RepID=A0ACC1T1L4_9APHY|nr:hypothetical protein NM688_g4801 [Phlebia brevispora]